ncbi:FecCD family ABC transporter permease [Paenibacillus eucommiae]|uniref:Iron complex transport system permease protein n=1 Tax=Paenibacillus eucommiae TaxID=1355755 RepID=A0ABS4J2Y5_9BACL|nr:iron ABC transporter permease [Paenibacillus eucommiae]MBP1993670.1 iron complex transport system permease protein [Paenibacillus eucommiae]
MLSRAWSKVGSVGFFPLVLIVLVGMNLVILCLQIVLGDFPISVNDAFKAVAGIGNERYDLVVNRFRFPRALVGFLVGAGLALSGVILQGITRNPLASPGVIGLNSGAALLTVSAIILVPAFPVALLPFAAFLGAFLAAALSYMLAWRRGLSAVRLVLVGVSISASAGAFVTFLLTFSDIYDAKRAVVWMTGSIYGRSWEHFWPLLPWLLVLFPLLMLLGKQLDVIQLGDELAKGLGSRLERSRGILLLISVSLAGASVAMAGTIGFVGLMAPHISRYLVGAASRRLMPTAALIGGMIVMLADLLGRTLLRPMEIPCGILIAMIGAPYMIYLLYKKRNM